MDEEGIFRISGSASNVQKLRAAVEKGMKPSFISRIHTLFVITAFSSLLCASVSVLCMCVHSCSVCMRCDSPGLSGTDLFASHLLLGQKTSFTRDDDPYDVA